MFQVISSLLPVTNLIFGENPQKIAKNRFKSYNSTANFSMFEIRIFRINTESGQSKTNSLVGIPRNKHRQPANKPVGAVIHDY
jgi:hypothetical protein